MTSVELLKQQLMEIREESEAAVDKHKTHIERHTSATIKEGHDLLRKLQLAQRDERSHVKHETLQDTPLTSRMPPLRGTMERAAVEIYLDPARKRKANNGYDAAATALGSMAAFHSFTGTSHAQYRMVQQQQQMMMYQQAMQQQNMMHAQWMSAHSAPSYTLPSQNPWANFSSGSQPNVSNQFYGISRNDTAALRGYPPIRQSGSATPVTTKDSTRYDSRNTQSFAPMGSSVLQYSTSAVDDVLSNEDAAVILALVEKESERSSSAATIPVTAAPSTNAGRQNLPYGMSYNTGPAQATRPLGVPADHGSITTELQAMGSDQKNHPAPASSWSYY